MISLALVCVALNVYYEARNDDTAGQVAVAQVVLQRMEHAEFPNSECEVIHQGGEQRHQCQFSWYCDGKSDTPYDVQAWESALLIASAVMAGSGHADLLNATHYHAYYVSPDWDNMRFLGRVGKHLYYEES